MFVVIDGIDGSGKDTILDAWVEHLIAQGKKVLNLKTWWAHQHAHPQPEDLQDCDVLISTEPTFTWVGAAIRFEMIKKGRSYSPRAISKAYALDRLILYKRVILPALQRGATILQSRSVSSSLAYQTAMGDPPLTPEFVAGIEGNAFALQHAPDHLFICDLPVPEALKRLGGRVEKQDEAIFEKKEMLEKLRVNFKSEWYQKLFKNKGTNIHYFPTDCDIDTMKQESLKWLMTTLNT